MFSEKKISIKPFDIVTTTTATSFNVEVNKITLFLSADLIVLLFDASGGLIRCDYLTLRGDDYKKWTNDDEYIFTYVANNYGFTLISPETNNSTVSDLSLDDSNNNV